MVRGIRCLPVQMTALADLFQHCVHVEEVPDLGELAAFEAIESELRNSHPPTGGLNSLESPQVGTGDREVHHDVVVVDNDVPHLPVPVREGGDQGRELCRNGGWVHWGATTQNITQTGDVLVLRKVQRVILGQLGRIMSGLGVAFLLMDGVMKLFKPAVVREAFARLAYPESEIIGIGVLLLMCTALYLIPRSSIFGAILLTGFLGGAVATHVRVGDPLLSHVLFPTYIAALLWVGLYLREPRLRALVPLTS